MAKHGTTNVAATGGGNTARDRLARAVSRADPAQRAMLAGAIKGASDDELETMAAMVSGDSLDIRRIVHGKPLPYWVGKTAASIRRENPAMGNQIIADLQAAGVTIADADEDADTESERRQAAINKIIEDARLAAEEAGLPEPQITINTAPAGETTDALDKQAGDADDGDMPHAGGRPYSELAGMSDEQLLELDGIGQATIKKIRDWQDEQSG